MELHFALSDQQQYSFIDVMDKIYPSLQLSRSVRFGAIHTDDNIINCPEVKLLPDHLRPKHNFIYTYYTNGPFTISSTEVSIYGLRTVNGWQGIIFIWNNEYKITMVNFHQGHCINMKTKLYDEYNLWCPYYRTCSAPDIIQSIGIKNIYQYLIHQQDNQLIIFKALQWDTNLITNPLQYPGAQLLMLLNFYNYADIKAWTPGGLEQYYGLQAPMGTKYMKIKLIDSEWGTGYMEVYYNTIGMIVDALWESNTIFDSLRSNYYLSIKD